jgi:tetratricopeptide (TPR) repeat protein
VVDCSLMSPPGAIADEETVGLFREALAGLGEANTPLRVTVMSRMALSIVFRERSLALSLADGAVETARQMGSARVLASALVARLLARWGPESGEELASDGAEIVRLGRETNDPEVAMEGYSYLLRGLVELGEREQLDASLADFSRAATQLRQPRNLLWLMLHQQTRALLDGRFDEADRLLSEAQEMVHRSGDAMVGYLMTVQLLELRWAEGRLAEVETVIRSSFERSLFSHPVNFCGLAFLYAELGWREAAEERFERFAERDFAGVPRDMTWIVGIPLLSAVCAFLGDGRRAVILYDQLLPFAARSAAAIHGAYWGSVHHYLGLLAATRQRWDDASRHFEAALASEARMGGRPFVAWTECEYGKSLLARGDPVDRDPAGRLLESALATAREIGMAGLVARIQKVGRHVSEAVATTAPASTRSLFRREGDYWTIGFGDDVVRLKDAKGLRYIAHLLRHPRVEIHAAELAGIARDGDSSHRPLGDAGEIIDHRARESYRRRLDDLGEELAQAERFNDSGRAAAASAEIDALTIQLAAAVGIGGRARRASSATERARIMVTKRIKLALRKIAGESPVLGRYLAKTIRTGIFCCYEPDARLGPGFDT